MRIVREPWMFRRMNGGMINPPGTEAAGECMAWATPATPAARFSRVFDFATATPSVDCLTSRRPI
jgi:hypothetical protein